ncbi:MAG TPA: copper ABC transporter, partial [Spirochaetia bacterium]|nr:copper ABC transporter [Spirochaetia bacterium]
MKKKLVVLMLCLSALNLLLISCTGKKTENHAGHEQKSVKTESGIEYFTCSMHPSVKSDKPGKCPICG